MSSPLDVLHHAISISFLRSPVTCINPAFGTRRQVPNVLQILGNLKGEEYPFGNNNDVEFCWI